MKDTLNYYIQEGLAKLFSFPTPVNPETRVAIATAMTGIKIHAGFDDYQGKGWISASESFYYTTPEFWSKYSVMCDSHEQALKAAHEWNVEMTGIYNAFNSIKPSLIGA